MTASSRMVGFGIIAIGVGIAAAVSVGSPGDRSAMQEDSAVPDMSIEDAHKALTDKLLFEAGIAGTAITECGGTPCLKVYVVTHTEEIMDRIPKTFEGYEVTVQETGEIEARE